MAHRNADLRQAADDVAGGKQARYRGLLMCIHQQRAIVVMSCPKLLCKFRAYPQAQRGVDRVEMKGAAAQPYWYLAALGRRLLDENGFLFLKTPRLRR